MIETLARIDTQPQISERLFSRRFLQENSTEGARDLDDNQFLFSLEDALVININQHSDQIGLNIDSNVQPIRIENTFQSANEEVGDFAKVKSILSTNKDALANIWGTLQKRAMQIQALCCPPGQSSSTSFSLTGNGSFSVAFANPLNSGKNHNFCEDDHLDNSCTCKGGESEDCPKHKKA